MTRQLVMTFTEKGDDDHPYWETDVQLDGEWCGGGTGPAFTGVFDIATNIVFPEHEIGCPCSVDATWCSPLITDKEEDF